MPDNGHLWNTIYKPGSLSAVAWRNGHKAEETRLLTTGVATQLNAKAHKTELLADGHDVAVINISALESLGNVVPTADNV